MKIKKDFVLRDVAGKALVIAVGDMSKTFKGIIWVNETGRVIWECLEKETTKEAIIDTMVEKFKDVDRETIEKDVEEFICKLEKDGILE